MSEILSQSEIDDLLKSISAGEAPADETPQRREARNYDFRRPSKFGKEQLRSLQIVFDNYSRMLSSFLTGYLRTTVTVEVASAEQVTFTEFTNLLVNPVILSIMTFEPLKGSLILDISTEVGLTMIDRILGGQGLSMRKTRDFSDLEKILLERVISQMLTFIPESWENIADISPRLDKIETNSQFAQIIPPNDMTALVTLQINIGGTDGLINFCLPYITMEPVMDRLNTRYWFTRVDDGPGGRYAESISGSLEKTNVRVRAVIGSATITVGDFVALAPGDIIPLQSHVGQDLEVYVGGLRKFRAKPGVFKGKNAIAITSYVDKEE